MPLSVFAQQQVQDIAAENYLNVIQNSITTDITRNQLANAIINYEAARDLNNLQYNQQLLFMAAPGSQFAINAGSAIGASITNTAPGNVLDNAFTMGSTSWLNSVSLLTPPQTTTSPAIFALFGKQMPTSKETVSGVSGLNVSATGPMAFYKQYEKFFTGQDPTVINPLNPSAILLSENLANAQLSPTTVGKMTADQSSQFVTLITNPFPSPVAAAVTAAGGTPPTGQQREQLAIDLAESLVFGVSTTAWGDIIARRTPVGGQQVSMLQQMDNYAQYRFVTPSWYANLGSASEPAVIREVAHILAFMTWMQFQQYRLEEQQVALLATMNAIMGQINIQLNTLNQQMQQAAAQASTAASQLKNSSSSSSSSGK